MLLSRIALRSVRRNWRHSLGSALAVAVGFAAIALFDGYLTDVERTLDAMMEEQFMMGTLVVERTGMSAAMASWNADAATLGDPEQAFVEEFLRAHADEVAATMRSLFVSGVVSNGRASTAFVGWGQEPAGGLALRRRAAWDAQWGRPLQGDDRDAVLLGRGLASLLDCAPTTDEPRFGPDGRLVAKERPFRCARARVQLIGSTASGQVNAVEPLVVGIGDAGRKEVDAQYVALPLALAQRMRNTRHLNQYNVLLRDPSQAERFAAALMAGAKARGLAIDAMPWQRTFNGRQYEQGMGILRTFRSLMLVVVIFIAGMAVFSTMVKAVNERTREVGTLRSLGFLRRHVTALFALEAAVLSGAACAVGAAVTAGIAALVNGAAVTYDNGIVSNPLPLGVAVDPAGWVRVAVFLVAVAVFAAWLPARRAARRGIPDALAWA